MKRIQIILLLIALGLPTIASEFRVPHFVPATDTLGTRLVDTVANLEILEVVAVVDSFLSETPSAALVATTAAAPTESKSDATRRIRAHFAWGADAGASIDMTGKDMTALNFSAAFGFSRGWINFLGVGAGVDIAVNNSCRSYPFFMEFRTNFVNRPTLLFWSLKAGASLNYLEHNHSQVGAYGSTGIGFNLARSSKFTSFIILAYTYRQRRRIYGPEMTHNFRDLSFASVRIGVTF